MNSPLRPMVAAWHREPASRCAKTITDRADALLSFENFQRYRQQSAATRDNEVAVLPPRDQLSRVLDTEAGLRTLRAALAEPVASVMIEMAD